MGVGESRSVWKVCMREVNTVWKCRGSQQVWKCRGSQLGVEDVLQEGAHNYETRLVVICARYVASPAVQ